MKKIIILIVFLAGFCTAQEYVYVLRGAIKCTPRDLPSVGIRQDNGQAVLGLHGAVEATKNACGWYAVQDAAQEQPADTIVTGARLEWTGAGVTRVREYGQKKVISLQDRVNSLFYLPELQPLNEDEKSAAIIQAVALALASNLTEIEIVTPIKPIENPIIGK